MAILLKSAKLLLLASLLVTAATKETEEVNEQQPKDPEDLPAEGEDRENRGFESAFANPFMQWRVGSSSPWDALSSLTFPDPFASIRDLERDVEEVTEKDSSKPASRPVSDPTGFSGFGGVVDTDQISGLGGISGLLNLMATGLNRKPWWKGPNVCVEREETADSTESPTETDNSNSFLSSVSSSFDMQSCHNTDTKYECVHKTESRGVKKSFIVRYQCCLGYKRIGEICEKFNLESMVDTLKKLNASDFILKNGYESRLTTDNNYTLFVPTDEAFKSFAEGILESNNIDLSVDPARRRRGVNGIAPSQLVESHVVNGFHDFVPDDILHSNYVNSTLMLDRVVSADGNVLNLVNCAKVISINNYATNGLIHTVDRVLMPVTKNIMQEIGEHPEFSNFKQLLEKTGLDKDLSEDETWTVYVPTNEAFNKLDERTYQIVTKGDATSKNIIKSHLMGPVICSSVVKAGVIGAANANGDIMKFTLPKQTIDNDNKLDIIETANKDSTQFLIGGVKVTKADIMATHGVIHAIDEVIIPNSALSLMTLLEKHNLTTFRDMIIHAKMADEIDRLSNVTFLVPTNDAIDTLLAPIDSEASSDTSALKFKSMDDKQTREFVLHHTIAGALSTYDMENNLKRKTLLDDATDNVRVNLYSTLPVFANTYNRATVNCARLVSAGTQQRENLIHVVSRTVPKQEGNVLEVIAAEPKLTTLKRILAGTELEKELPTMKDITFLAPINEVFSSLPKMDMEIILSNKKFADNLLRQHVIQGVWCCAGLHYSPWPFTSTVKNVLGQTLPIHKQGIGAVDIDQCDGMANNGVVHTTSSIMVPSTKRIASSNNPNVDIFLYGI